MTVVKAVQQLQQQGLLVRRPGSGTYVANGTNDSGFVFGLLIPELGQTEIFEPICRGMVRSPLAAKHSLSWGHTLSSGKHRAEEAEQLCQTYIEQQVDGVFFGPQEFGPPRQDVNGRILQALNKADIPVVLLDRCVLKYPERSEYDLVGLDNRRAGYIVTDHLIRQGASTSRSSPVRAQLKRSKIAFLATMRRCTITICLSPNSLFSAEMRRTRHSLKLPSAPRK